MLHLFVLQLLMAHAAIPANLIASGGAVEILAIGKPSFIKIHGKGASPTGRLSVTADKAKGQFEFDLTSLDTGIETRNEHMKNKYLEVGKFPKAQLTMDEITVRKDWSVENPSVESTKFSGSLAFHGVTHTVQGQFSIDRGGKVEATFSLNLTDFKVEIPHFAGVTVANDVQITVDIAKLEKL